MRQAVDLIPSDEMEALGTLLEAAPPEARQSRYQADREADIALHSTLLERLDNKFFSRMAAILLDCLWKRGRALPKPIWASGRDEAGFDVVLASSDGSGRLKTSDS